MSPLVVNECNQSDSIDLFGATNRRGSQSKMAPRASFYFTLLIFILTVVEIKSSDVDTNDNDYLRMSSNQFDGNTLNYHSITPARGKQVPGDVVNHIGKPLVPTTTTRRPSIQYVYRPTDVAPRAKYQLQEAQIDGRAKTGPLLAWNATVDAGILDQQQLLQRKQREHSGAYQPPVTTRPRPRVTTARRQQSLNGFQPSPDATTTSAQQPVASSSSPAATNTCKWMQLAEFKNVSYETGRMVFVDESEQPCYILTLRAFVRWNDTLYFPLRNYQPHPRGSYKINLKYPNDGSIERLVLNCSMPELNPSARTSISLLPNQIVSGYTFDEEITILVECGYLRLKLSGDGSHVSLNSISLYQNADLDEQHWQDSDGFTTGKSKRLSKLAKSAQFASDRTIMLDARETPMMLHKHQVFSSEPVHEAPLLSMPLISRYTCRHRIVLNGRNLVQFVLERFELQRLITSQPSWSSSSSSAPNTNSYRRTNPRASSSLFIAEDNHHEVDLEDPQVASRREFELAQEKVHSARLINSGFRIRRDTTILYKSPVLAVTRCPSPTSPTSPLNFMMDPGDLRRNDTFDKMVADRRIAAAKSSATVRGFPGWLVRSALDGSHVGLVNLIVTLYLAKQILNCSLDIHL